MPKILQINYKLNSSVAGFMKESTPVANALAAVPGLRWKLWLVNEAEQEAGGIYLFEDLPALQAYLEGPIVARLKAHPNLTELNVKHFDVPEDFDKGDAGSALTNIPFG